MTKQRYIEKEQARIAVARNLGIPYTVDSNKTPETDLLRCGPIHVQVVLADTAGDNVTFDPYRREGDLAVFIQRVDDTEFRFLGVLWNTGIDETEFWRAGIVSMARLKRLEILVKTGQVVGSILGIELFGDTRILRIAVIQAHYVSVGTPDFEVAEGDADFPLANVDQPDAPNTTVTIVFFRLHPGEPMTCAIEYRYHHRDSVSPANELDLTRRWCGGKEGDPDTMIAEAAALLATVREPTVLDVSHLDVAEALNVFKTTMFAFLRPTIS
jgi:hypothetical protein